MHRFHPSQFGRRLRFPLLLVALIAFDCAAFAQSPQPGGSPQVSPKSGPNDNSRTGGGWHPFRRDKSHATLTRQAGDTSTGASAAGSDESAPSAKSATTTAPPPSALGGTASAAAPVTLVPANDCDYWIVSSRGCSAKAAPADGGRCLSFFHRTSERTLISENRDTFLASIRPDRPVCFVVHGSYNWWRDVVNESRAINRWVHAGLPGAPVQVVIFTWPSDGNLPIVFPVDIAILGRKSAAHSVYLATLVTQLPKEQRVSLVGHSHGARTAAAALHVLGGGALEGGQALPPGFAVPDHLRAVLMAAAIDHQWLNPGDRYGQSLLVPERVLLMRNSRDATLAVYPMRKVIGDRALGKDGLGQEDRFAMGELGKKIVELDAADFANWHHSFADYHQHPELAVGMAPFVYFDEDTPAPSSPAGTPTPILPASPAARAKPAEGPPAARPAGLKKSGITKPAKEPASGEPRRNAVELEFEN